MQCFTSNNTNHLLQTSIQHSINQAITEQNPYNPRLIQDKITPINNPTTYNILLYKTTLPGAQIIKIPLRKSTQLLIIQHPVDKIFSRN